MIIKFINGYSFGKEDTYENLKEFYKSNIEFWGNECKNYRSSGNLKMRRSWEVLLKDLEDSSSGRSGK